MIVLLDDIKIKEESTFLSYVNHEFNDEQIDSFEGFRDYLLRTDREIEFMITDYDEIEDKTFAAKVMAVLMDMSYYRKNIKLTQM